MTAHALTIASPSGPCMGWFHPAEGGPRGVGVLLCRPLGYEALCSFATYTQLAHALARAGFDVMRFDYHGTGDSAGSDADPGRVEAWLQTIESAARELRERAGSDVLALFGMRVGGTLAVRAAVDRLRADALVLWAPCPSGRAFVREMRAANASRPGFAQPADGSMEALGTLFTAETLETLKALDGEKLPCAPARRVLIVGRDDMPGEGPLPAAYRALGADVTFTVWPGYAGMMAEPHDARLEPGTLAAMVDWLADAYPARHEHAAPAAVRTQSGFATGGVYESPVSFGSDGGLFGILAEPVARGGHRAETAVLLLNVGGNYRIGPNRVYVRAARELAAAGYRVLRLDVTGVGDSRPEAGFSSASMYRSHAVADVQAAMDMLAGRGCSRFWLMGICSGSYLAFETALHDDRVTGQVLLNSRLLEWDADRSGPWQSSMQNYYKSTRYYRQALLRSEVYGRLLRGKVDIGGILRRLWSLASARLGRAVDRLMGKPPREGVLRKFRHLATHGVETLVVMSEQDDGLDYMEFHLGQGGSRMRGHRNFRMALVPDADHTFSTVSSQQAMLAIVREHLDRLHQPAAVEPAVAEQVATI